jgi:hypothetical protein
MTTKTSTRTSRAPKAKAMAVDPRPKTKLPRKRRSDAGVPRTLDKPRMGFLADLFAEAPVHTPAPEERTFWITESPSGLYLVRPTEFEARVAVNKCGNRAIGTVKAKDYHAATLLAMAMEQRDYPGDARFVRATRAARA